MTVLYISSLFNSNCTALYWYNLWYNTDFMAKLLCAAIFFLVFSLYWQAKQRFYESYEILKYKSNLMPFDTMKTNYNNPFGKKFAEIWQMH